MYQVLCIGAGPSGSLSAYLLAKAGIKVAIIDKEVFPRTKLCGGGLSNKAYKMLEGIIDLSEVKGRSISGSYLCYKTEHLCHVSQNVETYSIQRNAFDNALLNCARDAGSDVFSPQRVIKINETSSKVSVTLKSGDRVDSEFVILAEGITGRLHKQIGYSGKREWTMALEVDVFPNKFPRMFNNNILLDFGFFSKGYGWIFPKDDRMNMGSYYFNSPRIGRAQITALEAFVRAFRWANEGKIGKIKAYPLPYRIDYGTYNSNRTILVGDASGAVENFFGEGLYYGFLTSKLAAAILIECFNNGSIDSYSKRFKAEILPQIKVSRVTAKLFYNHQHFGYFNMVRNTLMNIFYAKLIHGEMTHREVLYCTMLALPLRFFLPNLRRRTFDEIDRH